MNYYYQNVQWNKAQPEDGNEKVDEHDGSNEDVDTEHCHCKPRLPRAARHTQIIQVHSAVVAATCHVA